MKVSELMQRNVRTVTGDTNVGEVVLTLVDAHVSGLPVVDPAGRVIGVVSTSDVMAAEAEAEPEGMGPRLLEATLARDIMTPRPYTVTPEEDVREAARQMLYADVHRLFVTEEDRLVGVISTTDIVRGVANGQL